MAGQEPSMPPTITYEGAKGFGLFMLKELLKGRAYGHQAHKLDSKRSHRAADRPYLIQRVRNNGFGGTFPTVGAADRHDWRLQSRARSGG